MDETERTNQEQLSSHYSTFLEKIVTMFERIGSRLPSYKEHFECFVERRKRLSQSGGTSLDGAQSRLAMTLSYVYADIIQFCQSACKMFVTKKSGESPLRKKKLCALLTLERHSVSRGSYPRPILDPL